MCTTAAIDIAARVNRMDHGSRLKVINLKSTDDDETFWAAFGGPEPAPPETYDCPDYSDQLFEYSAVDGKFIEVEGLLFLFPPSQNKNLLQFHVAATIGVEEVLEVELLTSTIRKTRTKTT